MPHEIEQFVIVRKNKHNIISYKKNCKDTVNKTIVGTKHKYRKYTSIFDGD